jgi:hypothetical protein
MSQSGLIIVAILVVAVVAIAAFATERHAARGYERAKRTL